MKKVIIVLGFLSSFLMGNQVKAQFIIVGYVPNWINLNTFSSNFNYSRVTHLNIAFEDPDVNGDLPALSTGEQALVTAAHNNGVQVFMSICGGASSSNSTIRNRYFTLINSTNRSNFASKLKQYLITHNLDGLDLDLEGPAINGDYGAFVQVLADSLHPAGKLLTAALSEGYGGANVPASTFPYFDWINIMAYDAKGPWNPADDGQHSSYQMASDALIYWKGRGLPKSKAILGVPFYGYEFGPSSPSSYAVSYKYIASTFPDAAYDDEVASGDGNTIYFNGLSTIIDKTGLALTSGGGIMIWELSLDALDDDYSLLNYIRQVAGSAVTSTQPKTSIDKISFYPNPTTGMISFNGDQMQHAKIDLYNTMGEKIRSYSETTSIDISEEPKGIYYLHINKEGNRTINKIILQ